MSARVMTGRFKRLRRDLPDGREWLVTSDTSGNTYSVTVWVDPVFGRLAECSCKAGEFGQACKHLRFAQGADSGLFQVEPREIRKAA